MIDRAGLTLSEGMELAGLDVLQLWGRYVAVGGEADTAALADEVRGRRRCTAREHDLIAQALNECFLEQGSDTFPVAYSGELSV